MSTEFTDAITGDWGGKPFVDMQKGWKYILDQYPEVMRFSAYLYSHLLKTPHHRLMLIAQWLQGRVGVDMLSSTLFLTSQEYEAH